MSEVMSADDQLRAELEQLGVDEVRKRFVRGAYGPKRHPIVEDWLAQQDEKEQAGAQERQEARANEALALARRADKHADEANRTARIAAAFAFVTIIVSIFKW